MPKFQLRRNESGELVPVNPEPSQRRKRPLHVPDSSMLVLTGSETFNFAALLPGRASSEHTQRAYFRWVDQYLVDVYGMQPTTGDNRTARMSALPLAILRDTLNPPTLRSWLGHLAAAENGKQGLNQARAAVITLASLLSESQWLDDQTSAAMRNVRVPNAEDGQRPGRWLSMDELRALMSASESVATSENQAARNRLVTSMLCTMALRREELAHARWGDLGRANDRVILQVHGKGSKTAMIDIPRPVMQALESWRAVVSRSKRGPEPHTSLVRRVWKAGHVSATGLTADAIWFIVNKAAIHAGIGHVAPHDLRRSVAGALHEAGTPIEKISRLLRHSNVAVTERYLSRLPQRNEGGVLMSDLLGFEDE